MTSTATPAASIQERIYAGWVGKSIGGSLGMPYEGVAGPLDIPLERADLTPVPNDDLELQLLWLHVLERDGFSDILGSLEQGWRDHQKFYVDEYAIAAHNLQRGIRAPQSGFHGNWFGHGMGAAIRSEIWACLSPGKPRVAAALAHLDACVDHHGEGIEAEKLLAAMQSLVLVGLGLRDAIGRAAHELSDGSQFRGLIHDLLSMSAEDLDSPATLTDLHRRLGHPNFTDCVMNVGFTLWALLAGAGDFDRTMRRVISCGQDTDCTAATAAATLGMLGGLAAIPEKHRQRTTDAVVVSRHLRGLGLPATLDALSNRVMALAAAFDEYGQDAVSQVPPIVTASSADDGATIRAAVLDSIDDEVVHQTADAIRDGSGQGITLRAAELGQGFALGEVLADRDVADVVVSIDLVVDSTLHGWLMIVADAGINAWLDRRMIIDYHGRRPVIPAVHRAEGGATVPVKLEPGTVHTLTLRLLGVQRSSRLYPLLARADRSLVSSNIGCS